MIKWFRNQSDCDCGKRKVWGVITYGFDTATNERTERQYGPYYSKKAAEDFKYGWESHYKGYAVIDYRFINVPLADLGEV